ncbi:MAG: GNAT family N-acetyltransferase [Candidatus Eremiobacteraeota bacterium]|nr:GNAT family N-acetyltransferase [Candidatus Eremiobacteraeota bacterium]
MLEIESGKPGEVEPFWRAHDRDRRSELWAFRVVWHEQTHDLLAREADHVAGALRLHVAASLGTVDALYVLPTYRRRGVGRLLLARAEELANYYNCHKVSVAVLHDGAAQHFFASCGYKVDAVIPQHTFKLDVALLRKFLL